MATKSSPKTNKDKKVIDENRVENQLEISEEAIVEEATDEAPQEVLEEVAEAVAVEAEKSEKERFKFSVGDTIVVDYRVIEGKKSRIQPFEGIVIARKGSGVSKTFTVRRIGAGSIGVERIFPLFSPNIENIKIKSKGKVRRAKLYYLRKRIGKAAIKV